VSTNSISAILLFVFVQHRYSIQWLIADIVIDFIECADKFESKKSNSAIDIISDNIWIDELLEVYGYIQETFADNI
jgi:hypothetical protein